MEKGKTAEAKEMFAKEIELYPESEVFIGSILKGLKVYNKTIIIDPIVRIRFYC